MPSRTINFSTAGLFWECRLKDACDVFPEGLPEDHKPFTARMTKNPLSSVWTQLVDKYTWSNLTYNRDRLVALSGIARVAQIESTDQYVAGMWRKDLEPQLCWNCFRSAPPRGAYRAPTWSWASLDTSRPIGVFYGDIMKGEHKFTLLAHVVEVSVIPSGKNPLGNLSSAYLKISCTGLFSGPFNDEESAWYGGHLRSFEILELSDQADGLLISLDCDEVIPETLYVLPMVKKEIPGGEILAGLIIAPTGGPDGEFRRYGSFFKDYDRENKEDVASFQEFLSVSREDGPAVDTAATVCVKRDVSESEHPNETFIITLI